MIKPITLLGIVLFCFLSQIIALAAEPELIQLSDRSWAYIAGDDVNSNSALFVGDHAAMIVDPGLTPSYVENFLEQVHKVTDMPVRWAVITHWHPDHALGIICQKFPGITLLASPNTRRLLLENIPKMKNQ